MEKIKLNIQMFGSTNKTTNYELPQWVGTDKPSYLTDFNSAFFTIDGAIHEVAEDSSQAISDVADLTDRVETAESTVSSLDTRVDTVESTVQSASTTATNAQATATSALTTANTANGKADTNASNISSLSTAVGTNTSDIAELETEISKFNLTNFETIGSSAITLTNNGTVNSNSSLTVATNSDQSICKIYGQVNLSQTGNNGNVVIQTSLRPSESITINGGCLRLVYSSTNLYGLGVVSMTIGTDGKITVPKNYATGSTNESRFMFINSVIFLKSFGDTPTPTE